MASLAAKTNDRRSATPRPLRRFVLKTAKYAKPARYVPLHPRKHVAREVAPLFQTGGLLIHDDNLAALHRLKSLPEIHKAVRLIYIDPPYGTGQIFTTTRDRTSTVSRGNGGTLAYDDRLSGNAYLAFLRPRLGLLRDLLAEDGSIYVHIDCKMEHYVKCLMDEIFGQRNFINDISRIKCNPKNFTRKAYGNIKDTILFYAKSRHFFWNDPRELLLFDNGDVRFNRVDPTGRRYSTTPLHAPGETANGPTGNAWRGMPPPPGRHWRYPPKTLEELDKRGLIEWSSTGNPRKKIYLDEVAKRGLKMQDIWVYKDPQNPRYPTEKNTEMLKTVLRASSKPGDIVLDAFCGSGSFLVAAQELGRRWIGIDASGTAASICKTRLPWARILARTGETGGA